MSSFAASIQNALPSIERHGNFIRDSWDRLSKVPGGKAIFSRLIGVAAPYTGSMGARVVELRRGFARVELADRRKVRNHLDCIHAIALANLAELTGNVAVAYTLPDDARFIVSGMSIEYLKKARGAITGTAECPQFASSEKAEPGGKVRRTTFSEGSSARDGARQQVEYEIDVSMKDRRGEEVARATLQTLVGPKKSR